MFSFSFGVFLLGGFLLFYVYGGYGLLLAAMRRINGPAVLPMSFDDKPWPSVTVLLCVHNEEQNIVRRLDNLMQTDYPADKMEVLVVSDGSTDGTEEAVTAYQGSFPVRLVVSPRLGKSGAQNMAVPEAKGEVVVLTDAEAVFDKAFIKEIAAPFRDISVGCATGRLGLIARDGAISESQGLYWRYEQKLRLLESDLGFLAVTSGQCMAVRRSLYVDIPPFVGDDCYIPLVVLRQNARVVHCDEARAYDVMESEPAREYATRVRMTMRNWTGTWLFPEFLNPLRNPGYALALWSHKLLRWMGGPIMGVMALAALFMLGDGFLPTLLALGYLAFLAFGLFGYTKALRGTPPTGLWGTLYSFILVNLAFTQGLAQGLQGTKITAYRAGVTK